MKKDLCVIGIDPGESGVAFLLWESFKYIYLPWPDSCEKAESVVRGWRNVHQPELVIMENVPYIPGGQYASWKLGINAGFWEGLIRGLGLRLHKVWPKDWESILFPPCKGWTTPKHRSVLTARELIPNCQKHIWLKKHHNISDAALMAFIGLEGIRKGVIV